LSKRKTHLIFCLGDLLNLVGYPEVISAFVKQTNSFYSDSTRILNYAASLHKVSLEPVDLRFLGPT
jgi:hypothetical protein